MISGNTEIFMTPLRQISGSVEVIDTSTTSQSGSAVRLEGCAVGEALEVKLNGSLAQTTRPSRNLIDTKSGISYIKYLTSDGTGERARYGWFLDLPPGDYYAHGENINYTGGYVYLMIVKAENKQMTGVSKYLANGGALTQNVGAFTLAEGEKALLLDYTSSHTQADAEKLFYEDTNFQVEAGSVPTAYEPYGEVPIGEVKQYGKNLFDYRTYPLVNYYWHWDTGKLTTSNSYSCSMLIPCKHLRGKTITQNVAVHDIASGGSGGIVFYTTNSSDAFIKGAGGNKHTYTVPMNAEYMGITVPRDYANGSQVQIELGEYETGFEDYKEPKVFQADDNGIVEGVIAYATNTLVAPDGMTLTASYSIEEAGDTYTNRDKLKSISIERTGEGKFFGYGISQKATVELIDKDCLCGLTTDDKLTILFNDTKVSPVFYIDKVSRNEKSGDVKVEAQDILHLSTKYTVADLTLPDTYTIGELADLIGEHLKTFIVRPDLSEFDIYYEDGANLEGSETLREVLTYIAEATQTIYYVNYNNEIVFKRLGEEVDWTVDRSQYFELSNKNEAILTGISSTTDLGDDVGHTTGYEGITQCVRNNPLWDTRQDIGDLVLTAVQNLGEGQSIHQFNCSWRGNYLIEPGDKVAFITKDNNTIYSYLINDKIEYSGGYKQTSEWAYATQEKQQPSNPATLGEALKQTYARVDKANKQIEQVASATSENASQISVIQQNTSSISQSVSSLETKTNDITGEMEKLNKKVSATMTDEEITYAIETQLAKGVSSVETTTGFTFNQKGLTVGKSDSDISTTITENGMDIYKGQPTEDNKLLTANNEGVVAKDLHATTYLIIGKNSRFEDFGTDRTACFWIGA
jgi:hypothetical protein